MAPTEQSVESTLAILDEMSLDDVLAEVDDADFMASLRRVREAATEDPRRRVTAFNSSL
ncbi:hypothetical protein WEI85_28800 [Actinomycetes bacterium KLBMP 9797]